MSDKLDKSLNGGVEFVYGGKHNDSYYYFYDINGNETKAANEIVAKEIQSDNGQSYAIRVCGMKPAHHDSLNFFCNYLICCFCLIAININPPPCGC